MTDAPVGDLFEGDAGATVVVVHPRVLEVAAGKTREMTLPTAATRSSNKLGLTEFHLSYVTLPLLDPMLIKAQEHSEITLGAATAGVTGRFRRSR